jgi:hypothetical protein
MENYLSTEASSLSHNYEILRLLLIPKFQYHVHKSLPLRLYTARSMQSKNYTILFNIMLPSVPLSPDFFLPLSQSKSATISELHSIMKWIKFLCCLVYTVSTQNIPFCSSIRILSKEVALQSIQSFSIHVKHLHVSAVRTLPSSSRIQDVE